MTGTTRLTTALQDLFQQGGSAVEVLWNDNPGQAVRVKRNQTIFHESDPSDMTYLLLDGEVRFYVTRTDDDIRERTTLLLRAPAVFGDRDILAGVSARESAMCMGPARLLSFDANLFLEVWRTTEALRTKLGIDLARRYAGALELLRLQVAPLSHFVGALVHDFIRSGTLEIPPLELLASLSGAAPKSVQRALAQLRENGVLRVDEKSHCSFDGSKLESFGIQENVRLFHSIT